MSRRVFAVSVLTFLIAGAGLGLAASTEVLLSPRQSERLGHRDAVPILKGDMSLSTPRPSLPLEGRGAEYTIIYDDDHPYYYLPSRWAGDTAIVWFSPPAACSLLAIQYMFNSDGTANGGVWEAPDYVPGGPPFPGGMGPPIVYPFQVVSAGQEVWTEVALPETVDIGTQNFFAGWVWTTDDLPQGMGDASGDYDPPRTCMYRASAGGWYAIGENLDILIRAKVLLYANPPPRIQAFDKLPDTYYTVGRQVTLDVWDIGVPLDSTGVASVYLYYWLAPDTLPTDTLAMVLISGDPTSGTWATYLPPFSVDDEVTYYFNATDLQGLTCENTSSHTFTIRAGQPTAEVLFWNDDIYGAPYTHDPVASVLPDTLYDYWGGGYGLPDASVIGFGYEAIFVNTWDGSGADGFVADTALMAEFLDNGGKLFISSQDLMAGGFHLCDDYGPWEAPEGSFARDYLHMLEGVDDAATDTVSFYYGVPGDPISDPWVDWPLTNYPYSDFGAGYNYAGTVVPDAQSPGIFYDMAGDPITGFRYPETAPRQLVFLYWPFAYLVDSETGEEDTVGMNTLVKNILTWFEIDPGVEEIPVADARIPVHSLAQNVPNPVKDLTTISYILPRTSPVSLKIYDIGGRLVRSLVEGEAEAGTHLARWDRRDDSGSTVASGVYFYRLSSGDFAATKKMVVLR